MQFTTINPATEEPIAAYTTMTSDEVQCILKDVHTAFTSWKKLSVAERTYLTLQLAEVLRKNKEQYAKLMTLEMGKPIKASFAEIEKCAITAEYYAKNAEQWLADEQVQADGKQHIIAFEPMGVILAVMPWNFPFWQAFRFAIPTLIAGNTAILKHANVVPQCALAIEQVFKEAGFPENVFRTVIADHQSVAALISSDLVSGVSLTGSNAVGERIGELAGKHTKKVVLELGGSDPFIVFDDADIEAAAKNAAVGRTINAGQSCVASKRFIVLESVAQQFIERFAAYMQVQVLGNPFDEQTTIGPLVNEASLMQLESQVADALEKGAVLITGGKRLLGKGYFYEPTVLVNTAPEMKVLSEEVFGPVAPVIVVRNEEEAIAAANASAYGLGGSVWTRNLERGLRVARQVESGIVFVNSITKSDPRMPFGGVKKSGIGRELSKYGLMEFVHVKGLNVYESI